MKENFSVEAFVFPTSYAQKRMWFLDQFEPNSPYYNIPSAVRIRGNFKLDVFRKVIAELVDRHESLRTIFKTEDNLPVQVILPAMSLDIPVIEVSSDDQNRLIHQVAKSEARTPFNLSEGPLFRVKVISLNDKDYVVLLTLHHIISDGWSMSILISEIISLYTAYSNNQPSPLKPLKLQYADYSEWQHEYFESGILKKQLEYWENHLSTYKKVLDLPSDRSRPPVWTNEGETISIFLDVALKTKLDNTGRLNNCTLFMTMLAAFYILLARYTNQWDITVGTPIANRRRQELESVIGLFINTIVLRINADKSLSIKSLLQLIKKVTLDAFQNQDIPFEMLLEKLQPDRNISYPPLFQVMFIMQNTPGFSLSDGRLSFEMIDVNMGTSTFDLTFNVNDFARGLEVSAEYNTDLFDRNTIERMLQHYKNILIELSEYPECSISRIKLIDDNEVGLLIGRNEVKRDVNIKIHQLFESEADKYPDNVAIICGNEKLTYKEVYDKSCRIANQLLYLNQSIEEVIAICLPRSPEIICSLLGVLKSGKTYLPIDPDYPQERIQFILKDAGVRSIITDKRTAGIFITNNFRLLFIEELYQNSVPDSVAKYSVDELNLAYIIYTSGSTGNPKGTMVTHKNLVNAYYGWEEAYELRSRGRNHLQMASFSFDVFAGDWVRALCSGGTLIISAREILLNGQELFNLIEENHITIAEFVPVVLRNLVDYAEKNKKDLSTFNILIAGSDIWYTGEYCKIKKLCGKNTRLINSYGLTEAAIDSSFYEGDNPLTDSAKPVPIGQAFENSYLYILDDNLQIVPAGIQGELYIGGLGISRGYLNKPYLTAERFLPDPFDVNGSRMYRTGDGARYLKDGNVEFLGRIDTQVKVRGYRIETGEVESALKKNNHIKDAVVSVKSDSTGTNILVAYFIPANDSIINSGVLREFLKNEIPEYMVPSFFIKIDNIPLSPNGKIDKNKLPDPDYAGILESLAEEYHPPVSSTQELILRIWEEILQHKNIGIRHNFFELGGHSLLAAQVISRINESLMINLPLRSIFETPTVEGISLLADKLVMQNTPLPEYNIEKVSDTAEIPLSFSQQRLWFLCQLQPDSPFYNMPEVYKISGSIDKSILEEALNIVVQRHKGLRTTFHSNNGVPFQKVHVKNTIKLMEINLQSEISKEYKAQRIIAAEAERTIDITKLSLFRSLLIHLSDVEHILIFTIHHIISDDWSNRILLEETATLYDSIINNTQADLTKLDIHYPDYAYWQRSRFNDEIAVKQLEYWKTRLFSAVPLLELPFDKPRPAEQTFNGDYLTFAIDANVTKSLQNLIRTHDMTLFMVLLSVFQILLHKLSGQNDILIGTPTANRNSTTLEKIIGFFVNTLVMRAQFNRNESVINFLTGNKKHILDAFAAQELPFEYLVDAVAPERNLSHSPLFQVMFVMQTSSKSSAKIKTQNLFIEPMDSHSGTSKFDLTLFMTHEGGELNGALEYNTDLFEKDTVFKFIEYYQLILKNITQKPDIMLSDISLLDLQQNKSIIEGYNRGQVSYPIRNVVEAFEKQVSSTPNAPALMYQDSSISYSILNLQANIIAESLLELNLAPGSAVAVYINRSPELIISILGILKAGLAFLPLDLQYPIDRMDYMIKNSGAKYVITRSGYKEIFADKYTISIEDELENKTESNQYRLREIDGRELAYIIYTSGSTGKPKGVMITHDGLANYLGWAVNNYPVHEGVGSIMHSTIAFDATITSIFPSLITGKSVLIVPESENLNLLSEVLLKNLYNFSLIKITPAHLEMLALELNPMPEMLTKSFVIGGENLTVKQIIFYQKNYPNTLLFNEYGPTETVVGCIVYEASKFTDNGSVPIGKVIPNIRIYVLDQYLSPVPYGMKGELYIGGIGLARGYINRPDLTAERFLPDPFYHKAGARIYKTGDIVKLLKNGNLEFIGRSDNQVKIRGYRIELAEIEIALKEVKDIDDAIVIIRNDIVKDSAKITAYYIAQFELDIQSIISELQNKLPAYMIPSYFIRVEQWPVNINGKIERKLLPQPVFDTPVKEEHLNSIEKILLEIWTEVLGLTDISIDSNFFELGGDSIISIQIIALANKSGIKLTTKQIFQYPTVRLLAAAAKLNMTNNADQNLITGESSLTPIQEWFFHVYPQGLNQYNQSVLFEWNELFNIDSYRKAFNKIILHHDSLRLRFKKNTTGWTQFISGEDENKIDDIIIFRNINQDNELKYIIDEVQQTLNIISGPIVKSCIMMGKEHTWIFITVHHLAIDAVSWQIILEDLLTAYRKIEEKQNPTLPLKTNSVLDWSLALKEWQANMPAAEKEYWMNLDKQDIPPLFKLNGSLEANTESTSEVIYFAVEEEYSELLTTTVSRNADMNITNILIAALLLTLKESTGSGQISVMMESHGRNDIKEELDFSRTTGWFTAVYPALFNIENTSNYDDLLSYIKSILMYIPNNGIGYLMHYLQGDNNVKKHHWEVLFNYLGRTVSSESSANVKMCNELITGDRSPFSERNSLIELNCGITQNILQGEWIFSRNLLDPIMMNNIVGLFTHNLKNIIDYLNRNSDSGNLKTRDEFGWDNEDINKILNKLEFKE